MDCLTTATRSVPSLNKSMGVTSSLSDASNNCVGQDENSRTRTWSVVSTGSGNGTKASFTPSNSSSKNNEGANSSVNNKRKSTSLPPETVEYLKKWMMSPEHIGHPYPTEQEKSQIMADTGIELKQLTNWFVNNRKRYWKPRVEARLKEQASVAPTVQPMPGSSASASAVAALYKPGYGDLSISTPHMDSLSLAKIVSNANIRALLESTGGQPYSSSPPSSPSPQLRLATVTPSHHRLEPSAGSVPVATVHKITDNSLSRSSARSSTASLTRLVSENYSSSDNDESLMTAEEDDFSVSYSTGHATSDDQLVSEPRASTVCDEAVDNTAMIVTVTENITVRILKPVDTNTDPRLEDVTVLANVPHERLLRTFEDCVLQYSFPSNVRHDEKKVLSRRDAEIVRMKRHYLNMYVAESLAETTLKSMAAGSLTNGFTSGSKGLLKKRRLFELISEETSEKSTTCNAAKPAVVEEKPVPKLPRRKYHRASMQLWKEACQSAIHTYDDENLPSLDEAAQLFGFAN